MELHDESRTEQNFMRLSRARAKLEKESKRVILSIIE
jgi:hypothetical protein